MLPSALVIFLDESGCINKDKGVIADRSLAVQGPEVRGVPSPSVYGICLL